MLQVFTRGIERIDLGIKMEGKAGLEKNKADLPHVNYNQLKSVLRKNNPLQILRSRALSAYFVNRGFLR